mmetsp:Transcript_31729/g.63364  ORF Transcript_31729/g.63364 Transcript_31729/m.63364 type:complete len:90 (-) Transcript_31729:86-355(-)
MQCWALLGKSGLRAAVCVCVYDWQSVITHIVPCARMCERAKNQPKRDNGQPTQSTAMVRGVQGEQCGLEHAVKMAACRIGRKIARTAAA